MGESAYPVSLRSRWEAAAAVIRSIAAAGIAGLVSGVLVAGVGGRIVMRLAAIADPSAEGFLTDSGNTVGEITLDGTLELIIFGGIFGGLFGAIVWVMVRPWLRRAGRWRPAGAAVVSATAGTIFVINSSNLDFEILDPAVLNVLMFVALLAVFGAAVSASDSWLHSRLPVAHGWGVGGYAALILLGAPLIIPTLATYFSEEFCECDDPPRLVGAFLVLAGALTVTSWALLVAQGDSERQAPHWLQTAGELAIGGLVISGALYSAQQIADIV